MPAYNFQERFADAVECGIKRQTIRRKRKRPTRKGDVLFFYTGMRTKQCRKLGQEICQDVVPILIMGLLNVTIYPEDNELREALTPYGIRDLAQADGFNNFFDFGRFFRDIYGLPFKGEIIKW